MRVLVVDDNTDFLRAARFLLRQLGHDTVGLARCCEEGLALAAGLGPDVILVDLDAPDGEGVRTATRFKARDKAVPVIALGRQADESFHHRAMEAGCDAFIPKGDLAADLPRVLLRLAGRRDAAARVRSLWTVDPEPAHV